MLLNVKMCVEQLSLSMFVRATAKKTGAARKKIGGGGKVTNNKKQRKYKPKDI